MMKPLQNPEGSKPSVIIRNTPETKCPRYLWRSEWIGPFESTWGILQKFKFANQVTTKEVRRIFGLADRSSKIGWYDLINLSEVIDSGSQNILGISLGNHNNTFFDLFMKRNSVVSPSGLFSKDLRFCTDCIRMGFHSFFHQHTWLDVCPFHNTNLVTGCPECGIRWPYKLDETKFSDMHKCQCGYSFFEPKTNESFSKLWPRSNELTIKSKEVLRWLQRTDSITEQLNRIYFDPQVAIQHDKEMLLRVLSVLTPGLDQHRDNNYIVSKSFVAKLFNEQTFNEEQQRIIASVSTETYQSTFKAIARNIRKTILSKHRSCVRDFVRNAPKAICPYAYAYVNWRQHVEGIDSHSQVDNGVRRDNKKLFSSDYFHSVITWIATHSEINCGSSAATWIINHTLAHIWTSHFKTWLLIAGRLSQEDLLTNKTPFSHELTPSFLIYVPESRRQRRRQQIQTEFHTWTPKTQIQAIQNLPLECPRIGVHQPTSTPTTQT